jgi:hypothetical protein
VTAAQLNAIGGFTYNPATVGTDGTNALFLPPGSTPANPPVFAFGSPDGADYDWTVSATSAAPEPSTFLMLGLGLSCVFAAALKK